MLESSSSDLIPRFICLGLMKFYPSFNATYPLTSKISATMYSIEPAINTPDVTEIFSEKRPYFRHLLNRLGGKIK